MMFTRGMKRIFKTLLLALFFVSVGATTSKAGPFSIQGGKPLPAGTYHLVGVGWPSLTYEWWHGGGSFDWAIGGELVYGDWVGEHSEVDIGGAFNVPMKFRLGKSGITDVAFRLDPGVLIAAVDGGPGGNEFAAGLRAEMGVPVTIDIDPKVNIITGGNLPVAVFFVHDGDTAFVIPIYARIGVEVKVKESIVPWFLFELGPNIAVTSGHSDTEFGFRVWFGCNFG